MPTLDIPERQVLVDFFNDPNGFFWHHRVLLLSLGGPVWIISTPDKSVQRVDLSEHRVVVLARNAAFPQDRVAQVYGCDVADFSDAKLTRLRAEARDLATVLGASPAAGAAGDQPTWRICDLTSSLFGEEVPPAALGNADAFHARGDSALAQVDDKWLCACKALESDVDADGFRRRLRAGPGRDVRVLADERESDGRPYLQFALILSLVKELGFAHWPIQGPRSVKDYIVAIRALGAGGFLEFHADWVKTSGVGEKSAAAREHRFLLDLLRLMVQFDQLDPTCLSSAELLVRRVVQIELAVKKNAKTPDYAGLECLLETAVDGSGAAVLPKLSKWIGETQQQEAFVLKQMRLWSEEKATASKRKGNGE